ncbi:MAG: hypothetical protein KGO53_08570 [Alphaproteobacteria bacterium]|nr:hypothetical protein [Alphaproteobacteria bacterium]
MKTTLSFVSLAFAAAMAASPALSAEMLTAENGMTLYVYDKDAGGVPSCDGDCAKNWPPYAAKEGDTAKKDWSMVKRSDGSLQWAYEGKPLYFFAKDAKKGDKTGDGMGGAWHVVME